MAEVMTIEKRTQLLEQAISAASSDRNKAEAEEGVLKKELNTQYAKSRELGVEPENLGTEIKGIRETITTLFDQISNLVPAEYLVKVGL